MKTQIKPSKLELEVSEANNHVTFKVKDWQTKEQGYAFFGIMEMGPDLASIKIPSMANKQKKFGKLYQFFPNGRYASESEMRHGRGTEMLNQIIDYLRARKIPILYCHTDSRSLQNFFDSRTNFTELEEDSGDYLLCLAGE